MQQIIERFNLIWKEWLVHIVDIGLITYVFYRILLLLKGTRTVQIIRGLLILLVATFFAQVLELQTISWILQKFWLAWVVAIVVVFQPELRHLLAHLGRGKLSKIFFKDEFPFVNEITEGIRRLQGAGRGALIVIEQEVGLKNFIETGVRINAEISAELLTTIFTPPTALHDGAVIVSGDRLVAAGCILPLNHEAGIGKILGTRHRSGMGITEISDAWAIILSEETGTISLSREGRIERGLEIPDLKKRLIKLYRTRVVEKLEEGEQG